jgi:hypothetical protein
MGDTKQSTDVGKLTMLIYYTVLVVVGIGLLAFLTSPVWVSWSLGRSQNETYQAIRNVSLSCPSDTTQKIEAWSKAGYSVSCRRGEIKHGPWQAWSSGHLRIEGEFLEGKESGTWLYYTDDGKLEQTIKKAAK